MTTSEQAALLAKHWERPDHDGDNSGECCCADEWPCDVHRMAELKDAEIAMAVSEAVERIAEACEDKRSDVMNHLALEAVDSPGALALAGMEVGISDVLALLRSRDWSNQGDTHE